MSRQEEGWAGLIVLVLIAAVALGGVLLRFLVGILREGIALYQDRVLLPRWVKQACLGCGILVLLCVVGALGLAAVAPSLSMAAAVLGEAAGGCAVTCLVICEIAVGRHARRTRSSHLDTYLPKHTKNKTNQDPREATLQH